MDDTENSQDSATQAVFDKFPWIEAVSTDKRISAECRILLMRIALRWSRQRTYGTIEVHQSVIAEKLKVNLRQVERAFKAADDYKYFKLVKGRGPGRPNIYRLVIPETNPTDVSGYNPTGWTHKPDRLDAITRQAGYNNPTSQSGYPSEFTPSDLRQQTDFETTNGMVRVVKGGEKGTDPPPEPIGNPPLAPLALTDPSLAALGQNGNPSLDYSLAAMAKRRGKSSDKPLDWEEWLPTADLFGIPVERPLSEFCDKHPIGTSKNCHGCREQRELCEDWDDCFKRWERYHKKATEAMNIRNCKYCRDSDGRYTKDSLTIGGKHMPAFCEHPESLPDDHGRDYDWNKPKPVESLDSSD
jgi:hypothetical protein